MKKILVMMMVVLTLGLLLPEATQAQCVPSFPQELHIGQSYCIQVCYGSLISFFLVGNLNGTGAVPVITTQAGCDMNTDCGPITCTPLDPPHVFTLGGGVWFPDPDWWGGGNSCMDIRYIWRHDPGYWEIQIFSLCQGCFCLSFDDQLAAELASLDATAGDAMVRLNWTTSSESDLAHFNILRDNVLMAQVTPTNAPTGHSYQWTDANVSNGTTYTYTLEAANLDGSVEALGVTTATPNASGEAVVTEYALHQNFPNPFNPETNIRFDLINAGHVSLRVYNLIGQEVAVLVNGTQAAGSHVVNFDASHLTTGMYIYRIEADGYSATRKMMLIK